MVGDKVIKKLGYTKFGYRFGGGYCLGNGKFILINGIFRPTGEFVLATIQNNRAFVKKFEILRCWRSTYDIFLKPESGKVRCNSGAVPQL